MGGVTKGSSSLGEIVDDGIGVDVGCVAEGL